MERKGVVLRLGCAASVAGSMVVLKLDPPHGTHEGKGLRVWTYAYIGVVPTGCNHAWGSNRWASNLGLLVHSQMF